MAKNVDIAPEKSVCSHFIFFPIEIDERKLPDVRILM